MKKQGSGKKGLTGILLAVGALVLVAAVVLGILFLGGNGSDKDNSGKEKGRATLYWNVDRKDYVGKGLNGASGRSPRSDGYYYVRFAVGGEQVDYRVEDRALIEKIDQLDVVGLEFDEDGIVVGVNNINQCTGGLVANTLYVKSIEGNKILCNNQGSYKGMDVTLEVTEDTQIYDVGQTGLLCGLPGQVAEDDEIMAIKDYDGSIMYIYRAGYREPGDVYWNLTRKYNSTTGYTTREKDAEGFYVFDMALNGEVVQVRTRDMDIATAIDKKAARCTGLEFDENGMVSKVISATTAANGTGTFASWANVMEVSGDSVYAVKLTGSAAGTEYQASLAKNCKIINVCGIGGEKGSYTNVQYGDQIHGILDTRGRICYLWIVSRLSSNEGYQLYWNVEREYDSTNKVTKRTPSSDGYYYIDVATGGEQITVKTQDKELATKLDSYAARCFAMKITEDHEIVDFQSAASVHGGSTFGSWYYVDKIDGQNLTVSRILTGDTEPTVLEGVMAHDVEVINGSTVYSSHCGEYSTLQVGDRVHCLKDLNGNIRVIFIVEREVPGPVYWNINKKSVKNGYTTRERAEDGYFYFEMAAGGKQVTLKTKDIELATKIDNTTAYCMGLSVTGSGVITKHHSVSAVAGCQGGTKRESWVDVTKISGRTYTARKDPNSNTDTAGQYFTSTMASNCKVYNVSSNYSSFCGEETTLRVGDRIHALHNRDGLATVIFVVTRNKQLDEKDDCPCAQNPTWEPWDGTTPLENGKYYYLTADVTAPAEGFYLDGMSVYLRLDGHTISSDGRCFYLRSNAKLNICDHETRGKLIGNGVADEAGGVIRVYSATSSVNLWNIDLEAGTAPVAMEGGLMSCSGTVSVYNCNLNGGKATAKGGNIQVSSSGTFRMFGGTMNNGSAPSGANMNGAGRFYLEDATVTGSGSLTMNTGAEMVVNGLTAQKVSLVKEKVTFKGQIKIENLNISDGASIIDGGIEPESAILVTCKPQTSQVIMTKATEAGYKALTSFDPEDYVLSYDAEKKTVTVTCAIVPQTHENAHCACAGVANGVGEHTCTELTEWTELTADILVASPTSGNLAFPESGNYYLALDMELSQSIDILPGQEITLCLNGCKLTDSKRVFRINGTLNLTDCTEKGEVVGKAALAPVFYTYAGGTFNLFGGTLSTAYTGTVNYWGGVGAVANDAGNAADKGSSTMNMYGGTILGGKLTKQATGTNGGGALIIMQSAQYTQTFNMYGGNIVGGHAEVGGSVYATGVNAVANLLGGSILADADGNGGEVYVASDAVTVGGKVQIHKAYLKDGATLKLQELQSEASIGILMEKPGVFAESAEDLSACFPSIDENYAARHVNGKLKLDIYAGEGSHVHCVCGDTAAGLYAHDCASIIYQAWESTDSLPTESGNYYLTDNVVLTESSGLMVGTNKINLCMNGFNITNNNGRAFYLKNAGGSLNLCNCGSQGGVVGTTGVAEESGGVVRIGSGSASFGAYNVTLRRIDTDTRVAVSEGGVINCSGKLWLYGCNVENGYSYKGGNLCLALISKAVVVGCTFTDGEVEKGANGTNGSGGNIRIGGNNDSDPACLTLIDTTVTGGKAEAGGSGLYMGDASKNLVKLGGTVAIKDNETDNLHMAGVGNIELLDLADDSEIWLSMATANVIAANAADKAVCFHSQDSSLQVYYDGHEEEIYLASQPREEQEERIHQDHCICAGALFLPEELEHTCQNVTWTALTQSMFDDATDSSSPVSTDGTYYYLATGANYYLSEDVTLTKSIASLPEETVGLCLNGKNLHGDNARTLYFQGTLHLCDCDYTDEVVDEETVRTYAGTVTGTSKAHAHIFYARSGSKFYFYGGNLIGHAVGAAYTSNSGTGTVGGQMYMYGGVIRDGDCSANKKSGGNIRVDGVFEMYAGLISGGKAQEGGNIAIAGAGAVTISGGTVEGGNAVSGGNFAVFGKLLIQDDALIRDGVSTGTTVYTGGGNIYGLPNSTDIQITGGRIENGKAVNYGANIFLRAASGKTGKMSMTGGTVSGVHSDCADSVQSIYLFKNNGTLNVYVGGNAQVDEIRPDNAGMLQLAASGITEMARIGVSLVSGTGTVISAVDTEAAVDYTVIFSAVQAGMKVALVDDDLVIVAE